MKSVLLCVLCIVLAPFYSAVIQKAKAYFVGKKGPPLLINYYTILKLLQKGSVYSHSVTFIFKLFPVLALNVSLIAMLFLPVGKHKPVFSFAGDIIFLIYLFGAARFFLITSALDTASPFEGMGAAREAFFSFICEGTLFTVLIFFYKINGAVTLAGYFTGADSIHIFGPQVAILLLIITALFIVLLTENSRVPVDDPATHLELTMIHEVMILDHSGPDLAFIELASFLKLFFYAGFIANLFLPVEGSVITILSFFAIVLCIYICVGIVESITARFKMKYVPKFILTSFALAFLAVILLFEI
jgi:formate hydrogenlyase subunit 4